MSSSEILETEHYQPETILIWTNYITTSTSCFCKDVFLRQHVTMATSNYGNIKSYTNYIAFQLLENLAVLLNMPNLQPNRDTIPGYARVRHSHSTTSVFPEMNVDRVRLSFRPPFLRSARDMWADNVHFQKDRGVDRETSQFLVETGFLWK